ncbi:hypothetical protein MOQ_003459 [Trypanosoma cruzi marinkellei]|uniref:Uncharacterized protein n=1 Tax=Trypanosoma cruzi marinkellei TaxID=85056 RepID=K2NCU5_TRYCR|nr:hypothetical protein MOQ_003459 [Trypanosoma cruzi marinkellei]
MIPVAGRRKGRAPPPSAVPSGGEPDWLFAENVAPATGSSAPNPAPPSVPSAYDALSFLDFENETETSAPTAVAYDVSTPASGTAAPTPAQVAPSSASLWNQYEFLQKELRGTQEELMPYENRIKLLERGEDALCQEVRRLENDVCGKREEVERAAVLRTEREEYLELRRQRLRKETDGYRRQDLINTSNALQMKYETEVARLTTLIKEQQASLCAVKERHDAMEGDVCATDVHERILAQLQETLKKAIHAMGKSMCVRVKPFLIGSIREIFVQSAQQRLDILSNDRKRRCDEWGAFQQKMKEKFCSFQEERRLKHQARFDSALAHAVTKFRTALDNRLTTSAQTFAERQRAVTAETCNCTQRAIEEMVQRFREELKTVEKKQAEELKRTVNQYAAELAHHARLYAAEKEAAVGRRSRQAEEEQADLSVPSVYKAVEGKFKILGERVEQFRQSVSCDVQEVTSMAFHLGGNTFSSNEKALMLEECERNTRELSERLDAQWQRFRAAVAPLEQCVSSMASVLREGRVKVATMQQGTESVYRAWCQDVRRELFSSFTSSVVSSDCENVQSGVECITQVMENLLAQLNPLTAAHAEGRAQQRRFWMSIEQEIGALDTQRGNFNNALHAVFDAYDRLSRVEAELQAKRTTLDVAKGDFAAAKQQLDKERAEFRARLRETRQVGAELRQQAAKWGKMGVPGVCMEYAPQVLRDLTLESACRENATRTPPKGLHHPQRQRRQRQQPTYRDENLPQSPCPPVGEGEAAHFRKNENLVDVVSFLTVNNPNLQTDPYCAPESHEGRRRSLGSSYAPSSDPMHGGGGSNMSLTTPSTSNS